LDFPINQIDVGASRYDEIKAGKLRRGVLQDDSERVHNSRIGREGEEEEND